MTDGVGGSRYRGDLFFELNGDESRVVLGGHTFDHSLIVIRFRPIRRWRAVNNPDRSTVIHEIQNGDSNSVKSVFGRPRTPGKLPHLLHNTEGVCRLFVTRVPQRILGDRIVVGDR